MSEIPQTIISTIKSALPNMNGNANGYSNGNTTHTATGHQQGDSYRNYNDDRDAKSQETVYTTSNGVPYPHPYEVQRGGEGGPLLLQDFHLSTCSHISIVSEFLSELFTPKVLVPMATTRRPIP
jgi:hypothetical protein